MATTIRRCLQIFLKLTNAATGFMGVTAIYYGIWMMRVWQRNASPEGPLPWFIHAFVLSGIGICATSFLGHFAVATVNRCCISCYTALMLLLIFLETTTIANTSNLEKYLPVDPSGRSEDIKDFLKSNMALCEWFGSFLALAQGWSILLAVILKALRQYEANDLIQSTTDEESHDQPSRFPLLNQPADHIFPYYVPNLPAWAYDFRN